MDRVKEDEAQPVVGNPTPRVYTTSSRSSRLQVIQDDLI